MYIFEMLTLAWKLKRIFKRCNYFTTNKFVTEISVETLYSEIHCVTQTWEKQTNVLCCVYLQGSLKCSGEIERYIYIQVYMHEIWKYPCKFVVSFFTGHWASRMLRGWQTHIDGRGKNHHRQFFLCGSSFFFLSGEYVKTDNLPSWPHPLSCSFHLSSHMLLLQLHLRALILCFFCSRFETRVLFVAWFSFAGNEKYIVWIY